MKKIDEFFKIILPKGNFIILNKLNFKDTPTQFKHLKLLINPKTGKKFSTRTISESLKNLDNLGLIKNTIVNSPKRKVIAYSLSNKGKQTLEIFNEAQSKYKKLK